MATPQSRTTAPPAPPQIYSLSPPSNYTDCSYPMCTYYCPQWCYFQSPPPPSSGDTNFTPLIVSIFVILVIGFFLMAYCKARGSNGGEVRREPQATNQSEGPPAPSAFATGLDQSPIIESIAVSCYKKEDGQVEGGGPTECAVCLSEFQENEKLGVLPKCSHAFHLPCIDKWLKSHSNCPLCRANVASSCLNVSSSLLRVQPGRDSIEVVVEDPPPETDHRIEGVVEIILLQEEDFEEVRTSPIPLEEGEIEMGINRLPVEIGTSREIREENCMETERLSCTRHDNKGKQSVIPD